MNINHKQTRFIDINTWSAPCCHKCAYEVRCEKDTSWRGRCEDYAEWMYEQEQLEVTLEETRR